MPVHPPPPGPTLDPPLFQTCPCFPQKHQKIMSYVYDIFAIASRVLYKQVNCTVYRGLCPKVSQVTLTLITDLSHPSPQRGVFIDRLVILQFLKGTLPIASPGSSPPTHGEQNLRLKNLCKKSVFEKLFFQYGGWDLLLPPPPRKTHSGSTPVLDMSLFSPKTSENCKLRI